MKIKYIRREKASDLILNMMIWSVATILGMRAFLFLADKPMIAFGSWHIAHMLWGGLLMLLGFLLLVVFTGRRVMDIAVALEGVGWGLFVDEIGKFLTRDNDYWFRPAIIFIYVSFILMFILYKYLNRYKDRSTENKLFGLIDSLEEIVNDDLEINERKLFIKKADEIMEVIKEGDIRTITQTIKGVLTKRKPIGDRLSWRTIVESSFVKSLDHLLTKKFVQVGLWVYAAYWAVNKMIDTVMIVGSGDRLAQLTQIFVGYEISYNADVYMIWLKIIFDTLAAVCFAMGAGLFWTKKRNMGLRYFRVGFLVSIFLSSIFKFYFEQFSGVFDFGVSLMGYSILNRYIGNVAAAKKF